MSDLQISLLCIGLVVVVAVVFYNGYQQRKLRQRLCQAFGMPHQDVLLCEGGGELNDALFRGGLVNELHLTICPKIFGGRHAPPICAIVSCRRTAASSRGFAICTETSICIDVCKPHISYLPALVPHVRGFSR